MFVITGEMYLLTQQTSTSVIFSSQFPTVQGAPLWELGVPAQSQPRPAALHLPGAWGRQAK